MLLPIRNRLHEAEKRGSAKQGSPSEERELDNVWIAVRAIKHDLIGIKRRQVRGRIKLLPVRFLEALIFWRRDLHVHPA